MVAKETEREGPGSLLLGVLVGKGTRSPLSAHVVAFSVGCELKNGSLCVFSVGYDLFKQRQRPRPSPLGKFETARAPR